MDTANCNNCGWEGLVYDLINLGDMLVENYCCPDCGSSNVSFDEFESDMLYYDYE